jgi:hypothetical protein
MVDPLPVEAIAGAATNLPESANHRKTDILNTCPPLEPSNFFRSFQHLIYLIEIEITEQWRNHAPYAKGNFSHLKSSLLGFGRSPRELEGYDVS